MLNVSQPAGCDLQHDSIKSGAGLWNDRERGRGLWNDREKIKGAISETKLSLADIAQQAVKRALQFLQRMRVIEAVCGLF